MLEKIIGLLALSYYIWFMVAELQYAEFKIGLPGSGRFIGDSLLLIYLAYSAFKLWRVQ